MVPQVTSSFLSFEGRFEVDGFHRFENDRKIVVESHSGGDAVSGLDGVVFSFADGDAASGVENPVFVAVVVVGVDIRFFGVVDGIADVGGVRTLGDGEQSGPSDFFTPSAAEPNQDRIVLDLNDFELFVGGVEVEVGSLFCGDLVGPVADKAFAFADEEFFFDADPFERMFLALLEGDDFEVFQFAPVGSETFSALKYRHESSPQKKGEVFFFDRLWATCSGEGMPSVPTDSTAKEATQLA